MKIKRHRSTPKAVPSKRSAAPPKSPNAAPSSWPGRRTTAETLNIDERTLRRWVERGVLAEHQDETDRYCYDPAEVTRLEIKRSPEERNQTERADGRVAEAKADEKKDDAQLARVEDGASTLTVVRGFRFLKNAEGEHANMVRDGVDVLGERPEVVEHIICQWLALDDKFVVSRTEYEDLFGADIATPQDLRARVGALHAGALQATQQLKVTQEQVAQFQVERQQWTDQAARLKEQAQETRTEKDKAIEGWRRAIAQVNSLQAELTSTSAKIDDMEAQLGSVVQERDEVLKRVDQLEVQVRDFKKRCLTAEARSAQSQTDLAAAQELVKTAQAGKAEAEQNARTAHEREGELLRVAMAAVQTAQEQTETAQTDARLANTAAIAAQGIAADQVGSARVNAEARIVAEQHVATMRITIQGQAAQIARLDERVAIAENRAKEEEKRRISAEAGRRADLSDREADRKRAVDAEKRAAAAERSETAARAQLLEAHMRLAVTLLPRGLVRKPGQPPNLFKFVTTDDDTPKPR